jgi:hypothetical protein
MNDYGKQAKEALEAAARKIEKRMGYAAPESAAWQIFKLMMLEHSSAAVHGILRQGLQT